MAHELILNDNWRHACNAVGGVEGLTASAVEQKACQRWRKVKNGETLLRLILAYCLGGEGLRATVAWAASLGLADIANTALLKRLAKCENWLNFLIGRLLACPTANRCKASRGRPIRIVDGSSVVQAGADSKKSNALWRLHAVFDLPGERFSFLHLTDEKTGERLDMAPVIPGEIRLADRAYLQPERIKAIQDAGGDVIVRAAWTNARWVEAEGQALDFAAMLRAGSMEGKIDRPISIKTQKGDILNLRCVAVMKPKDKADEAVRKVRAEAKKKGRTVKDGTLEAARWVIVITSLDKEKFSLKDIFDLYRLRWRIELAFKRLKSIIKLKTPPGKTKECARAWILAHLLMILLIEPLVSELDDSPRWKIAA